MVKRKRNLAVVITGAGTGVGRAVAIALARENWSVALLGRTERTLKETARAVGRSGEGECLTRVCDIGDPAEVKAMAREILERWGHVDALVNSAGTNVARRSLAQLSTSDYQALINTNLNGAFYCIQAFLPGMRRQKFGTIVNVISDAGKLANALAGPAYVASKFGLAGLTQSVNAEERGNGIRACAIFPGEINTPLLDKRPKPPPASARARMLQAEDVAACVLLAINVPDRVVIEEMLVRPR